MAALGVVSASLVLVVGSGARALVAFWLDASPTLVATSTVQAEWAELSEVGVVATGLSRTLASALLALSGWALFRRRIGRPDAVALVGWLTFSFAAWIPTALLLASTASGTGEWMAVLERFPNRGPMRASGVVTGLFIAGVLWRGTKTTLAQLVGNGPAKRRVARARTLTRSAWLAGGGVALVAALLGPLDLPMSIAVGVGSVWGAAAPVWWAARSVAGSPVPGKPLRVDRSWLTLAIAGGCAVALVFVFGPGLVLGGG